MQTFIYLIMLLTIVACGAKVNHDGYVKHEMVINLDNIKEYFEYACEQELAPYYPTEVQIEECVKASMSEFVKFFKPPTP